MKTQVIYEPATETAKKIRKALKAAFPQTKFSVTSKTFSGGDSVSIRWTDLPLTEEVQAITSKFQSGHYNGYEDIYESGSYSYEGKLYNGAKYIQCSRNLSDEYKETVNDYLNTHFEVSNMDSWDLQRFFNQAEKEMNEATKQPIEIVEVPEVVESNETITCEMKLNDKLNGVELYFTSKPSMETRELLLQNKFRYSPTNKCWYAKQSEKSVLFAESFVSAFNDTIEDVETTEPVNVVEETPVNEPTEITYNNDNKIKIHSIKFEWSESNVIEDGQTVSTFEEAEHLIKLAAHKAPSDGCYDKTKFILTWTDGNTYTGRIDIVKSDSFKVSPLKDHISYFAKSVIEDDGTWHTDEQKGEYRHFLETYSLEDEKEITPLTNENKQPAKGKVLDFSSRFKAKQEKKETQEMTTHFIDKVLPYMSHEEITELKDAYESKDENKLDTLWKRLMVSTAIKRAADEVLK